MRLPAVDVYDPPSPATFDEKARGRVCIEGGHIVIGMPAKRISYTVIFELREVIALPDIVEILVFDHEVMKPAPARADHCKAVMAAIHMEEIHRIRVQRIVADMKAENVAVKRKQRCDIGNMKNRMPHAVGTCQKPFYGSAGAKRICGKTWIGEQLDTVSVRVVKMDHALDKPLVTQAPISLGDRNAEPFDARCQPVEIGSIRHLPSHKGELVTTFVKDHQPLAPVIHTEGHRPSTSVDLLHAKKPTGIVGPVGKRLRPDTHISKRNNRHVLLPSSRQPSCADSAMASHLGLSPNDA